MTMRAARTALRCEQLERTVSDLSVKISALEDAMSRADAAARGAAERESMLRKQLAEASDALRQWRDLFAPGLHRLLTTSDAYADGTARMSMDLGAAIGHWATFKNIPKDNGG